MPLSDSEMETARAYDARVASRVAEARDRITAASARGGRIEPVTLVAVTKTHGPEAVRAAWLAGVADVGENRVQEAEAKMAQVQEPVRWHLIGHLQRNKAKGALRFALVHGMDSERLAEALNSAASNRDHAAGDGARLPLEGALPRLDVLLQLNVSGEATKGGIAPGDVAPVADRLHRLSQLRVVGAMTMAPFDAPEPILRSVFSGARKAVGELAAAGHPATVLSMGMSGDYEIAVEEGATHVRLGTILFGERE